MKGVHQAKGNLALMKAPENRVLLHIAQHIVHPSHVPLIVEPQPSHISRTCSHGPRCALFSNCQCAGNNLMRNFIKAANEVNRIKILSPAKAVRNPLPGVATKVQIEHGRDSIHAQSIQVILFEPKERATDQKVANFVAPKVEYFGSPILMLTLSWVRVFIKMRAIKEGQPMRIT